MRKILTLETLVRQKYLGGKLEIERDGSHSVLWRRDNSRDKPVHQMLSELDTRHFYVRGCFDSFIPIPALYQNPKVLLIGVGGGTLAYQLCSLYNNLNMVGVDLDPRVPKRVREFLPEIPKNFTMRIADGTEYLKDKHSSYEMVILDAYAGKGIPLPFMKTAFIRDAYAALKEHGILAIDFCNSNHHAYAYRDFLHNLRETFDGVYIVKSEDGADCVRLIVCAKGYRKCDISALLGPKYKELNSCIAASKLRKQPVFPDFCMSTYSGA